jgi:hypothetical protein
MPFPEKKGTTPPAERKDIALLIGIILAVTAVVSGLLNLFVFRGYAWSLYVIGGCVLLWIFCLPIFFDSVNAGISILLDGIGISAFFGMISLLHPGNGWYIQLAVPAILSATCLLMLFWVIIRKMKTSVLSRSAILLAEIALYTVILELLIEQYFHILLHLTWSAVVLTCCAIIDAALITIIRRTRLREEIRRRMHI